MLKTKKFDFGFYRGVEIGLTLYDYNFPHRDYEGNHKVLAPSIKIGQSEFYISTSPGSREEYNHQIMRRAICKLIDIVLDDTDTRFQRIEADPHLLRGEIYISCDRDKILEA